MALGSGFNNLDANNTFSDWLNKTNEMITLFRTQVVTAVDGGLGETDGDAALNGTFVANTFAVFDNIRGGDQGNTAQLNVVSNTVFDSNADFVRVVNDFFVEGDAQVTSNLTVNTGSLFVGNIEAQSTIEFTGDDSTLEFKGANQDFIWLSTNTHATIRTNSIGSLELNADVSANGDNESRIDLKVDSVNVASFVEGGNVQFYSEDGTSTKVVWNANGEVLGINTDTPDTTVSLDVSGNTTTTDLVVTNEITANVVTVEHSLRGTANLEISSNVTFQANALAQADLVVDGSLTPNTLIYVIDSSNYDDLIPTTTGDKLGNTTNRWDGYFANVDVSSNLTVTDTITTDKLIVSNTATLPAELDFSGVTDFEDINVSGVASFANLEVQSLTTNKAGLIGVNANVQANSATVIDEFDKTVSKGFKYIIHGDNDDGTSAFAIEINCSHNGGEVFFTRFGEVKNNFNVVLVPRISDGGTGANVELVATCNDATVSNTHNFNILRIETRNG